MPNTLSISNVSNGPPDRTPAEAASPPSTPAPTSRSSPGNPNPTLRLEPSLGLVVIEFVSRSGKVTSTIPSQRQLQAYQDGSARLPDADVPQQAKPTPASGTGIVGPSPIGGSATHAVTAAPPAAAPVAPRAPATHAA